MKNAICWGGDQRMKILSEEMCKAGFASIWIGGEKLPDIKKTEYVILPVPTLDKDGCLNGSKGRLKENDILYALSPGSTAVVYLTGEQEKRWKRLRPDVHFKLLNSDQSFLAENGKISAEGAMMIAGKSGKCLYSSKCVVLGYGYLGRALCKMLKGIGASVVAVGRYGGSIERAGYDGIEVRYLDDWYDIAEKADWIFNTIPQQVISKKEIDRLNPNCWIMELASAPYGIDADAVREKNLKYSVEASIPGRYYPYSSAEAMLSSIMKMERREGE